MVPNSRIIPPPNVDKDLHNRHASPYTTSPSVNDSKPTRYLSRTVSTKQGTSLYPNAPPQVKRKPLGDPMVFSQPQPTSNNTTSYQRYPGTPPQRLDLSFQSPPLSPPPSSSSSSSSSSTIRPSYDRSLDPSLFQGQHERSYSTDALTSDDAKKVQNKKNSPIMKLTIQIILSSRSQTGGRALASSSRSLER